VLRVIASMNEAGVEYVIVGGVAMSLLGLVRATEALDVFIRPDPQNIERLRRALRSVWQTIVSVGSLVRGARCRRRRVAHETGLGPSPTASGGAVKPMKQRSAQMTKKHLAERLPSLQNQQHEREVERQEHDAGDA
jgi:hypothetical protein